MKIGVVGLGYWGPNLVRNFLSEPMVDGVIACDNQPKKNRFLAHKKTARFERAV